MIKSPVYEQPLPRMQQVGLMRTITAPRSSQQQIGLMRTITAPRSTLTFATLWGLLGRSIISVMVLQYFFITANTMNNL